MLKKLFGKLAGSDQSNAPAPTGDVVEHDGYRITPSPKAEGNQFYVAGTISKEIDGDVREHQFVRADTHADFEAACEHSVQKARQIIKESGERIFRDA